jgi:hypothetical protein
MPIDVMITVPGRASSEASTGHSAASSSAPETSTNCSRHDHGEQSQAAAKRAATKLPNTAPRAAASQSSFLPRTAAGAATDAAVGRRMQPSIHANGNGGTLGRALGGYDVVVPIVGLLRRE